MMFRAAVFALCAASPFARAETDQAMYQPFLNAMDEIRRRYVDESKASASLLQASALEGVIGALDAESLLLPQAPVGGPAGIGASLGIRDGAPVLLDVVEGGPADLARLRPGDRILRVNGESVYGKKRPEAEWLLQGAPGSSVAVMWATPDGEYTEATLTRTGAVRPSWRRVRLEAAEVFQVFRLDATAAKELKAALAAAGAGVVLDLRSASGGDPDAALDLANLADGGLVELGVHRLTLEGVGRERGGQLFLDLDEARADGFAAPLDLGPEQERGEIVDV
ncbi:MAG: PDZ domain-containing protein, partial [bacterium]